MVTKALPWAPHGGPNFSWKAVVASGVAGLLAACGGGGGGNGGSTTAPITRAEVQAGDYFVYTVTNTYTTPPGQPPFTLSQTRSYMGVAADGTSQVVDTYSVDSAAIPMVFDVNDAFVGNNDAVGSANIPCPSKPASQTVPPYPRSVGQTWSQTIVQTCAGSTTNITVSGKVLAREQVTVPAGVFDSYKVERTASIVVATTSFVQTQTCWYSVLRGVKLQCDDTTTQTQTGSTTPTNVVTSSSRLTGWGGPVRASLGSTWPRFAGYWHVQYSGGNSGDCAQLLVTTSGDISGSCTAASGVSFNMTGSVADSGAIGITLASGGTLTGTLNTPYSGQGNWADGGLTGTWTASHN